jgi:hypothetical protein
MSPLILKPPIGEWTTDDYDVLADGEVVGRIMKVTAAPERTPWMWRLAYGHHKDRWPTHGYEPTREAALQAFARSWHREAAGRDVPPTVRGRWRPF